MIRPSRGESLLLGLIDVAIVVLAFVLAYELRFSLDVGAVTLAPAPFERYAEALVVVVAVVLVVLRSRGLYEHLPPRGIDVLEDTLGAVTLASVVVLAASFFYRDFSYSRSVCLLAWGLLVVGLPAPRLLLMVRRRRRYARGLDLVPAVIVGAPGRAHDLARRLGSHRRYGLDVRGVITPTGEAPAAAGDAPPWLGPLGDLALAVGRAGAREVLICDTLERLELLGVLETCEAIGVEARVVPCVYDLFTTARDLTELHGVPFIAVRERRFELLSRAAKRAVDLVVGGALLVVAAPVIALLAWLVRRESAGAALFVQRRVGEGGAPFRMWKLRSMVDDAEARLGDLVDLERLEAPVFKLEDDPRVTRVGRFLRRWSLDELPQLWNVVKGDMSLVGPRPEEEAIVARYDAHHRRRLKAKPGLTGLQQLEARGSPDLDERVRLDVYYIRRRTLLFDLWLLARTPWAVLRGRGAT
ncbi:MAG: sugar transferase [Planctomycetes bacterium]|nr:sugar transferase [Planctomycetota bacterium]